MNAAEPAFCPRHFDAILCRHVLWALPDPAEALRRWSGTLKPSGQLLLIEGYWHTGGGMRAAEIAAALPGSFTHVTTIKLSARSDLWGGDVTDERYLVSADLGPE